MSMFTFKVKYIFSENNYMNKKQILKKTKQYSGQILTTVFKFRTVPSISVKYYILRQSNKQHQYQIAIYKCIFIKQ